MASIRIPSSANALLPFCSKYEDANDYTCFDTYAQMVTVSASIGYHSCGGNLPASCRSFLTKPYPIDLAIFRSPDHSPPLISQLLSISMSVLGNPDEAIEENRLVKLIEDLADEGFRLMEELLVQKGELEFPWALSFWIANPPGPTL
jgi:hypothetical protein